MDLSFLNGAMPQLKRGRQTLNFYDLFGLRGSELAADQTLAYFLDPDERHEMGARLLGALLRILSGARVVGRDGLREAVFDGVLDSDAATWHIDRQVAVRRPSSPMSMLSWDGVIDILITNHDADLAIVIENKIGASLGNPLESYVGHALDAGYETVLLAVLAPNQHQLDDDQARWVSRTMTYGDLFEAFGSIDDPHPVNLNQQRSVELLRQFREVRGRGRQVTNYLNEAKFLEEFRGELSGREEALDQFFRAQDRANKICRARSEMLKPLIEERLDRSGLRTGWEAHGYKAGRWTTAWNAYELTGSNNSVELILTADPKRSRPITAKAYPGRSYKNYPDLDHVPIGVDWSDQDEDIADAFVVFAVRVASEHPSGA